MLYDMRKVVSAVLAFSSAFVPVQSIEVWFGASFGTPARSDPTHYIVSFRATLHLPAIPKPEIPFVVIWPGLETSDDSGTLGLIQSVSPSSELLPQCKDKLGTWCVFSYYLDTVAGPHYAVEHQAFEPGTPVDIHYSWLPPFAPIEQEVSVNGTVISRMSTYTGSPERVIFAIEYQEKCMETRCFVPEHLYTGIEIEFEYADEEYGQNMFEEMYWLGGDGPDASLSGSSSPPYISDNGKTWHIDSVQMPATGTYQG